MNEGNLEWKEVLEQIAPYPSVAEIDEMWLAAAEKIEGKIIVLDDDPTGIHFANTVIGPVNNIEGTIFIHVNTRGRPQGCLHSWSIVTAEPVIATPGDSGDDTCGTHLADTLV